MAGNKIIDATFQSNFAIILNQKLEFEECVTYYRDYL
jgi:hypothetical protein